MLKNLLAFAACGLLLSGAAHAQDMGSMGSMSHSTHSAGHMVLSTPRPLQAGDQARADAVAAAAKASMAPYTDYKKALAEGYQIFMPRLPQKMYHFTNYLNAFSEGSHFDPSRPTSLLYEKTADGGYKLIGAMYTDRVSAPESELDKRIPLSIARWHQHTNFCKAPRGQAAGYVGHDAKFGLMGSIETKAACDAAGGSFQPNLFGWMVHVYPYETDPKKIWSIDRDDEDGDMKGMKM